MGNEFQGSNQMISFTT